MSAQLAVAKPSRAMLVYEIVRPYALFALFAACAACHQYIVALAFAVTTFMAAFVQLHDAMHFSTGLPRKWNDVLLTLSALLLFKSGHGVRGTHLQHHALNLGAGDLEGAPARWSLARVIVTGPYYALLLRFKAFGVGSRRFIWLQWVEGLINVAQVCLSVWLGFFRGYFGFLEYWLLIFSLTCLMPLWASYIPHHIPEDHPWMLRVRGLARDWTPAFNSYLFHEQHHRSPKTPARRLRP